MYVWYPHGKNPTMHGIWLLKTMMYNRVQVSPRCRNIVTSFADCMIVVVEQQLEHVWCTIMGLLTSNKTDTDTRRTSREIKDGSGLNHQL